MQFIKIDPTTRTIEAIETTGTLQEMYRQIGCQCIDFCVRHSNGDALVVDDEALLLDPQPEAFAFKGYPNRIHGIALVTGSDEEGETTAPIMTLEEVKQRVVWLGAVHTTATLVFVPLS